MSGIFETNTPMTKDGASCDMLIGSTPTNDLLGVHQSYRLDGRNYLQWA